MSLSFSAFSIVLLALVGCGDDPPSGATDSGAANPDGGATDVRSVDVLGRDGAPVDASTPADVFEDAGASSLEAALARLEAEEGARALDEEVEAGSGWPLVFGDSTLFLTEWPGAPGAVSWTGDSNAFEPAVDLTTQVGDYYYAVVEGAAGKYKWHAGTEFRAPPEARLYGSDEFGEHGWVRAPGVVHYARYRFASHLVRVWISTQEVSRVLVLHDGQNLFGPDAPFGGWRLDLALPAVEGVLAIAIDNTAERFEEYTHVTDAIEPGGGLIGGGADAYLDLVLDTYVPRVREAHGVSPSAPLAMAGSSLGGLVSLYAALERDLTAVAALSPTLGWGAYSADGSESIEKLHMERLGVGIYIDSGGNGPCADADGDGLMEESGSDNFCVTTGYRDHLESLGYVHGETMVHWHQPGAPHNEGAWRERGPRMLQALTDLGW